MVEARDREDLEAHPARTRLHVIPLPPPVFHGTANPGPCAVAFRFAFRAAAVQSRLALREGRPLRAECQGRAASGRDASFVHCACGRPA